MIETRTLILREWRLKEGKDERFSSIVKLRVRWYYKDKYVFIYITYYISLDMYFKRGKKFVFD